MSISAHTHLEVFSASKTAPHWQALPLIACNFVQVCALQRIHACYVVARPRHHRGSRACPGEGVFSAQVCISAHTHLYWCTASKTVHTSTFVAHQRQRHDSRTWPCEHEFNQATNQVCALQRQRRDGRACLCERVFDAHACALQRAHTSPFVSNQDSSAMAGPAPASVCSILKCALQRMHTCDFVMLPRRRRDSGLVPASVCSTRMYVCVSIHVSCHSGLTLTW